MRSSGPHTESMEAATAIINQGCHACSGTGTDSVFGGACSECAHQEATDAIMRARYAGVHTGAGDRAYTPGDRMDGRTFGGSSSNAPSEKQIAFIAKLAAERNVAVPTVSSKQAASAKIEELLAQQAPKSAGAKTGRGNRYAGSCAECGGNVPAMEGNLTKENGKWTTRHVEGQCGATEPQEAPASGEEQGGGAQLDLSSLPAGTYAIPGGDTRLKVRVDNVTKGKWEGWVFVKDGAEYGNQKRYGKQAPGSKYSGDIEAELAIILSDPQAAMAAYGKITSRCGVCSKKLEDADSVARGIGPVCAQKF